MYKFYFLFLFIGTFIYSQNIVVDEYKSDIRLNDFRLNGKVKRIKSTAKDYNGQFATLPFYENELFNQVTFDFNRFGFLEKKVNYLDYYGKLGIYSFVEYFYNNSNFLINERKTIINNGEDPVRVASDKKLIYSNNVLISLIEVIKSKSLSIINYETNFKYSQVLHKIINKVEGKIISENNLIYNKDKKLVSNELISFDGKKKNQSFYIYDGNEPVLEQKVGGNLKSTTFFDKGTVSKIMSFDSGDNLVYEAFFDSKREIKSFKKQSFKDGKPLYSNYVVEYTYDKHNNWILAKIFDNTSLKYTVNRVIEYY